MDLLDKQIQASLALQNGELEINMFVEKFSHHLSQGDAVAKEIIRKTIMDLVNGCIAQGRLQVTLENSLKDGTQKS